MDWTADGAPVSPHDSVVEWSRAAHASLVDVAQRYNRVVTYADLAAQVQEATGVWTNRPLRSWISPVLDSVAQRAVDDGEPPLTSLCVTADGSIGGGHAQAPRASAPPAGLDHEAIAAIDRLACYRRYASDLPADGGAPTLTPQVTLARRVPAADPDDAAWLAELIARGTLTVGDRVPFRTHVEVARIFGKPFRGHQRATFRLDSATEVWFPRMYDNRDWSNSLSFDERTITMQPVEGGSYGSVMVRRPVREVVITFGQIKPNSGPSYYAFLGVFRGAPDLSDDTKWVHQRIADTITFDGRGGFGFGQAGIDDATAEGLEADADMVRDYRDRMVEGSYAVDDVVVSTKARGSAQRAFADAVKANYGGRCAVTGISTRAFLVASHIVPWSEDKSIRLDPTNGICLSTFVDRAFDSGFVAITEECKTVVRWDRVGDDDSLRNSLTELDGVTLNRPAHGAPDPSKLARRLRLI